MGREGAALENSFQVITHFSPETGEREERMFRTFTLSLFALAGLLAWQGAASAQGDDKKAEEIKKWTGFWQVKHDQYTEYWELVEKDGKWTVNGAFANKDGISVGTYFGADPMLNNGV